MRPETTIHMLMGLTAYGDTTMSNVEKFPAKGLIRNEDGEITGAWSGGTPEKAAEMFKDMKLTEQAMPLADDMARALGYDGIFSMPEEERFEIVSKAKLQMTPAND